jgi:gluconolactonase
MNALPRGPGLVAALLLVPLLLPASAAEKQKRRTLGTISRLDPRFDKLVPKDAALEVLADGFLWVEGPAWVKDGGYLLFSDIPRNAIWKWKEGQGKSIFLQPSGLADKDKAAKLREPGTNGLRIDARGRLVACDHGNRAVWRMDLGTKKKTVLVNRSDGKRFNSPNDLVFTRDGRIYFTDPPYGLMLKGAKDDETPGREMDYCGIYSLSEDGKQVTLLTKEMSRPNGLALSPDEKTLYVANSDPKEAVWMAFPVKDDGTLGKGRVFYDSTKWVPGKKGLPDGMKADAAGNLFATGPGGVLVFSPDGTLLGVFETGVPTANCAFGDDGRTLYVAADKALCRVRLTTRGLGF